MLGLVKGLVAAMQMGRLLYSRKWNVVLSGRTHGLLSAFVEKPSIVHTTSHA
jgi:hypothetical protein